MNFSGCITSGYPPGVLVRAADLANVVAIKYEVGRPGIAGDLRDLEEDARASACCSRTRSRRIRRSRSRCSACSGWARVITSTGAGPCPSTFALLQQRRVRRGDGDLLAHQSGAAGARGDPGDVRRRQLHPSLPVEVPGLAAGLQRRPDAPAGHEAQRLADAHGARPALRSGFELADESAGRILSSDAIPAEPSR